MHCEKSESGCGRVIDERWSKGSSSASSSLLALSKLDLLQVDLVILTV